MNDMSLISYIWKERTQDRAKLLFTASWAFEVATCLVLMELALVGPACPLSCATCALMLISGAAVLFLSCWRWVGRRPLVPTGD
jgi:hypothetical protein